MQYLLPLIRDQLQTLPQLRRLSDVYITPSINWLPTGTRPPCVGIVPGPVARRELSCSAMELTLQVQLALFADMATDGEAPLLHEDNGLYLLADDASTRAAEGALDIDGCQGMTIGADARPELFQATTGQMLVRLVRTLIYTVER